METGAIFEFECDRLSSCATLLFRDFAQDSGAVCAGVFDSVLGSVHGLHLSLQHCHEAGVHRELAGDCLVYAEAQNGEAVLR